MTFQSFVTADRVGTTTSSGAVSGTGTATQTVGGSTVTAPYAERKLRFQFALGKGSFGADGQTTLQTPDGLRATAFIDQVIATGAGGISTNAAFIRIWGLKLDEMNELSRAGLMWDARQNEVVVTAGDDISGMTTIFKGIVQEANPDFRRQEDASFYVRASPGILAQLKPVAPTSFPKSTDVATALKQIAGQAGWTLENNGVNVQLGASYWPGTIADQISALAKAANVFFTLDGVRGVLAIWPKTGSRAGDVIEISPASGMIGYPEFSSAQVTVRTLFGPQVYGLGAGGGPGRKIRIKSQLRAANGEFIVSQVTWNLSSQMPGGPWEAVVRAYTADFGQSGG